MHGNFLLLGIISVTVVVHTNLKRNSPKLSEYFNEGMYGELECEIIRENGTTEKPTSSSWYRDFSNGTTHQFTSSYLERVHVLANTLVFWPNVTRSDQGWYYCCVSPTLCSNLTKIKQLGKRRH